MISLVELTDKNATVEEKRGILIISALKQGALIAAEGTAVHSIAEANFGTIKLVQLRRSVLFLLV